MTRARIVPVAATPAPLAWALVVAMGAAFGLHFLIDPDLFAHIAVGRAILADPRSIGVSDFIQSYPAYPYVEDKWLASAFVAALHAGGGAHAVMAYQIAVCVAVAVAWYVMLRVWGTSRGVAVVAVGLALLTCSFRLEPRPDSISHALLAATMAIVVAPALQHRLVWVVPLLFVLWVNVHGYFVNGLLVLIASAVATALGDRSGPSPLRVTAAARWLLVGLALTACLLHPQGWRALASPVSQVMQVGEADYRNAIQELEPSTVLIAGAGSVQWSVLLGPFLLALGAALRKPDAVLLRHGLALLGALPWLLWPPPRMDALAFRVTAILLLTALVEIPACLRGRRLLAPFLLVGFTVLAAAVVRNLPLVTAATLVVVGPAWTLAAAEIGKRASRRSAGRIVPVLLVTFVAGIAWLRLSDRLSGGMRAPSRTGWGIDADRFPVGAADFVVAQDLPGPLLNNFDSGGYLLYRMHPPRRVFIAGNTSMYPWSFFADYLDHVTGSAVDLNELERRFDVRTAVVDLALPHSDRLFSRLQASPSWRLVFLDRAAAVYTRADNAPRLDLNARVEELTRQDRQSPALPTWLGGKELAYPCANLAIFLQGIGRPDLALRVLDGLPAGVLPEELVALAGTAALQTGVAADRLAALEDAHRRFPRSTDVTTLLFLAHGAQADRFLSRGSGEAESHLMRMLELRPDACGPYNALAKAAVLASDRGRAKTMLAHSAARDADGSCRAQAQADPFLAPLLRE